MSFRSAFAAVAALLLLAAAPLRADVTPGQVVTKNDLAAVKDLISPSLEWILSRGAQMKIIEAKPIQWPKLYREATEKYSSQVRLAPDGLTLQNYVAGAPFPTIDLADPKVATKIMWNYEYRPFPGTDDFVEYDFPVITGQVNQNAAMTVERLAQLGEARRLYYNGRLVTDPKPELPNSAGYRYQEFTGPFLSPFDLKGIGGLTYRYFDPSRQDDTFLYLPSLRRVRRLSTAQRSDALFGTDADPDSFWGYAGHIAWMEWKFLGEKDMLVIMHGEHLPIQQCPPPADFMFCESWEKRPVYAIEARSKLPQYAYSKRVLYIDKQAMVVSYEDIYDRAGQLWKIWLDDHQFRSQGKSGATQYSEDQDFYAGLLMLDMQLSHATYVPHPGPETRGDGWFFNAGTKAITDASPHGSAPDVFTIANLIAHGG